MEMTIQGLCKLTYRGSHPLFLNENESLIFMESNFSDVTLILRDGIYKMNSCLLSVISPYFRMSSTHLEQDENTVVIIPDLSYHILDTFFKYIFQNKYLNRDHGLEDDCLSEISSLLGCNLFTSTSEHSLYLSRLKPGTEENVTSHRIDQTDPTNQTVSANNRLNSHRNIIETDSENSNKENLVQEDIEPKSNSVDLPSEDTENRKRSRRRRKKKGEDDGVTVDMEEMELSQVDMNSEKTEQSYLYTHQFPDQLMCHSCLETGFSTVGGIIEHLRTVHCWSHSFDHCAFCDIPFLSRMACIKHEKNQCKNTSYSCYLCGAEPGSRKNLLSHLLRDHERGIERKCPHCHVTFLTFSTLEARMSQWRHPKVCDKRNGNIPNGNQNKRGARKTCSDCGAQHTDVWKHRRQCVAINNDIKHTCYFCNKGFRRLGSISKHFKLSRQCGQHPRNQQEYQGELKSIENPVKGFTTCSHCGLKFSIKKGRLTHVRNCSAFTRFKCHACNKGMNALDGFHIHFSKFPGCRAAKENKDIVAELMARSAKPDFHVCHLCGVHYKTKETFDKHMLTHQENVNYFFCHEPECGKQFLTAKSLDIHLKKHTMPMVICSICGKQVKQGSLGLHMVLHTGKKVTCPLCGKLFQHRGVLNKHFTACHTEKKRRRKKGETETKNLPDNFLDPIMQTIQVDLTNAESVSHQDDSHGGHSHGGQGVGGHGHGGQGVTHQPQIIVPQPPTSFFTIKNEEVKLENPDQHQDLMRSRQILVNSAGQIVVPVEATPNEAVMVNAGSGQQGAPTGMPVLTQPSYHRVLVNSTLDVNSIMQNQDGSHSVRQYNEENMHATVQETVQGTVQGTVQQSPPIHQ